jgi:cobalt-zinc-cadmium efflux system membrane fusion protein
MKQNMRALPVIFLTVSLLMGSTACQQEPQPHEHTREHGSETTLRLNAAQVAIADIATDTISLQYIGNDIKASGVLDVPPQNQISINAALGGFVSQCDLLPGSPVRKGQVIVSLEHPDYIKLQQDYLEANNQLTFTAKEYERQKTLYEGEVNAAQKMENAESAWRTATIRTQALAKQLLLSGIDPTRLSPENISAGIHLVSPINGYVVEVQVNKGLYVMPNQTIATLIDKDHIHMELQVFERDMERVKQGQHITARIAGKPGKIYEGEVFLVNHVFNAQSKTLNIHGHFKDEEESLLRGMFVEAVIHADDIRQEALPESAFVQNEEGLFCFIAETDSTGYTTFVRVAVEGGPVENGYRAVKTPPELRQKRFVTRGAYYLLGMMNSDKEREHSH